MLILVGTVKASDHEVREMMGLVDLDVPPALQAKASARRQATDATIGIFSRLIGDNRLLCTVGRQRMRNADDPV